MQHALELTASDDFGRHAQRHTRSPVFDRPFSPLQRAAGNLAVQRHVRAGSDDVAPDELAPVIVLESLRSPGQALDAATRQLMQRRFRFDFGQVRIHTDSLAAQSARAISAHAYTVSHDVVFGAGQYAPGTNEGNRLLAHELAHVAQQASVSKQPGSLSISEPGDVAEKEADAAAEALEHHESYRPENLSSKGPSVARFSIEEPGSPESTPAASTAFPCNPDNDEGFPLVCGKAPGSRARDAVGFAQEALNFVIQERILPCFFQVPQCLNTLPEESIDFIQGQLAKLGASGGFPLVVDCKCGPNTEAAIKVLQAFVFKDRSDWDGVIGPKTWIVLQATAKPLPIPGLTPIPAPPKPILL